MKQKFKWLLALVAMVASINLMWAGEKTYTHAFSTKPTESADNTLSSVVWTFGSGTNLGSYNSGNYAGVQLGTSSASGKITMTTKKNWGEEENDYKGYTKIKEIHVWLNNGSGSISASVKVGGVAATASGTVSKNSSAKSYKDASKITYTPASNSNTGKIEIAFSTSSKAGYFCAVEVVCEQAATPAEKYTVTIKDGGDNILSTLTESAAGAGVTLPNQTTTCEDWTFLGYSETKFASETQDPATEPTIIEQGLYKPTKNITLYPVFNRTESTGGTSASYKITYKKGADDTGSTEAAIDQGGTYATLGSLNKAYQRSNGMHLSSGSAAGNATLTLTNAGKVKASSIVTNALAKASKSFKITVTYTDATTAEQSFTPGTTSVDNTIDLDNTKTISTIYYSANSGTGTGIASTTVNYTNSVTHNFYITTPSCAAPRDIDHIEVTGTPDEFWKGDAFNHTGMTVMAYYTEGDPDDVTSKAEFSTPDMTTAGEKTITVTYKEKTATYTIDVKTIANTQATAYTATEAIAKYIAGKDLSSFVYVKGIVSKIVTEFSSNFGNISFNVSADGETTSTQFQFYRNFKGANNTKWTSADEAPQVGDEVIGYGTLTAFGETYEFAEGNYIVSLTRPKVLQSISVSGTPESFDTEKEFNSNNMVVTAHYNPGHADAVVTENATFTPVDWGTEGNHTINVSYTENGVTKGTTYVINVLPHCNQFVEITKGTPQHGSFTLSAEGEQCADGLVVTVTPNAAEHYHFKQITATNGDVDDNAKTVSNITANTTINVEFEEDEKVTVKWHVGTAAPVETANVYIGTAFADVKTKAPSVADDAAGDCANKFMGWATSAITDQDGVDEDAVAWATEPISNENKDFYAVWAKVTGSTSSDPAVTFDFTDSGWGFPSDYQEATATYTNGGYSIDLTGSTGNGYKQGTKSVSGGGTENVSIIIGKNGAKILLPQFTFPVSKIVCDGYSGGGTNVQYNVFAGDQAVSTAKTGCQQNGYEFAIAEDAQSSQLTLKVISAHNLQISKMYFYAGASYSNYITSCFIPTYSVTIQSNNNTMGTAAINPEHIKDAYEQGDELEVNATVTESSLYRFVNWTIEPATTGASLYMGANEAENLLIVGTGDITLTANFEEIPADPITVTLEVGEYGTLDCDDCVNNTITEKTAGDGVLVPDVIANEGWAFLGWSTSSTATEAQYKPADADIFYPSDDNKTLYAVYAQLYKVTLKYTDEVLWQETAGGAIALPTDRNCKNETYKDHFAGWSETEFAEETTNPTETPTIYAESITPTKDVVLYPVFSVSTMGGTKWVKTTGDQVTGGVYAIITTDGYAFNGNISDGHGQVTENTFTFDANNLATSVPTGICEITMQAVEGGFKMYNAEKKYLYAKAASAKNLAWHDSESSYWCWESDNWMYAGVTNARIRDYNNTIRTYGSNNGAVIQFAKKESVAENKYWSKPANDVTNPELDLAAGNYLAPQTIKITDDTYQSDYAYRYTTDGSAPSKSSTVYDHESGIKLETANTYTIKVIGYDEDNYETQIASATYVLYPVFNSISDMYAGATNDKPVGLVLTNAYVHAVNTIGQNSQIFVQQDNLGVVLSTTSVPEGVEAGKQVSGTATGTYKITNGRPQISSFAFQSTFSVGEGTRPEPTTITETTVDLVNTNLLGLVKLEGVYAQSDENNIIVVNSNKEGTGTASNIYDFFNKVSTIPANDIECNVIGLFNERKGDKDPEIVYSIMPVLATDFDVVEKQNATLPDVKPVGGASEGAALPVAQDEIITITPVAGFTTSYKINDAAEWTEITTQKVQPTITAENTKIEVKATRPYYNDASATYFYHIDAGLTKYPITLPYPQTYVKTETDLASAKAGDKVTITISQNQARYWETSVTVVKTDEESVTTDVTSEGNHKYSFIMPAHPVTVRVTYADAPKVDINYNKGDHTGIEGEMPQEHAYIGDEYTLTDCAFHAAGLTFAGWKAYKTGDKETPVTITDNKIIVPDYNVSVEAQWDMAPWKKEGTWELVTKTSELGVGDYVIFTEIVNAGTENARSAGTSTVKKAGEQLALTTNISISGNKLTRVNNDGSMVFQLEEGNVENTYAFYADGIGYLNANGDVDDKNYMITSESKESNNASWAIESIDATTGEASVKAKSSKRNLMQVNVNNSIFAAYNSKQGGLAIYKFYPKAWTVTFDDNVEDEEIEVPEMQRADPTTNKVTISTDVPVRTGYDFSIWNSAKGGTGVISAEPGDEITLSQNTTLYAQWSIKQYNVAVAEVENVTIQAKPHSEEAIAEGANADVNFKKSVVLSYSDLNKDYVFKSWKVTKADDETTVVPVSVGASSTTFEVPAYAVKVSAVIESKATTQLKVTYYANGGVNKTPEGPEEVSEQVNWNTTIKFSEHPCPFEKNLCTFVGWNTKADGTGTTYKTQVTVKTDIDLYAMWEASAVEYVLDKYETDYVYVHEGVAPTGSTAAYTTNYTNTIGQLTGGKYGTLTLTGYAGKVITGIKMEMKTNSGAGAGTIVVKVGENEICSTSYAESFGNQSTSYNVKNLVNFKAAIVGESENITITTTASANSLYIKGYTIEYEDAEVVVIRDNLTIGQYTTYCEPYAVVAGSYSGATFWNIADKTYMSDNQRLYSITIEQHLGDLEAGVPYIMLPEDAQLTGVKYGEAVDAPAAEDAHNGLVGVFETTMFDDVFGPVADDAAAIERGLYIISNGTLYLCGNNCGVYGNRAYIQRDQINPMPLSGAPRRVIGNPNGTPTNLNGLNGNVKAQKALIDGHIYIIRENKMYNAQGLFVK